MIWFCNFIKINSFLMKFFLFILFVPIFTALHTDSWKPGKTDPKGNLIIVEMENNEQLKDRPHFETVCADMTWSILIRYDDEIQSKYYIFNNDKKLIFSTESFDVFLKELRKIPDHTTVRDIQKCTISFSYLLPEAQREAINALMKEKNCTLETRIMFCWCGAVKMTYPFAK